ncbi:MAG: hypothetical protein KF901_14600 [Myxococcales bacterium]|nr:hypothetical protein [Myxococcales bacterium]
MSAAQRAFVYAFSLLVLGAMLSPLARHPDEDSFPLSTYPMFSRERPREMTMTHAVGVDAEGRTEPLSPRLSSGNREVLQSMVVLQQAVHGGRAQAQCEAIAARVAEARPHLAQVVIETITFDAVAYFEEDRREPDVRDVHARCEVPR